MQASTAQHLQQQLAALCSSRVATEATARLAAVLLQQAAGMAQLLAVTGRRLWRQAMGQPAAGMVQVRLLLQVVTVLRRLLARTGSSSNSSSSRVTHHNSNSSSSMVLLQGMVLLLQAATGSKRMRSRARTALATASSSLHSSRCISRNAQLVLRDR
jgi:hypothetical protein